MSEWKELPLSKVSSNRLWICVVVVTICMFMSICNASKLNKIEKIVDHNATRLEGLKEILYIIDRRAVSTSKVIDSNNMEILFLKSEIETIYSMFSVLNERSKEKLNF